MEELLRNKTLLKDYLLSHLWVQSIER